MSPPPPPAPPPPDAPLKSKWLSFGPLTLSVLIHGTILLLIGGAVIFEGILPRSPFLLDESLVGDLDVPADSPPGGPDMSGEPSGGGDESLPMPETITPMADASADILVSSAPTGTSFLMPPVVSPTPGGQSILANGIPGGRGTGSRSPGFGKGVGIGKGIGDWIGTGGSGGGGLGISGRGKTLKTINEFNVYFVIHSGDWYAALDTKEAPEGRQKEESPPGLPDEKNIKWFNKTPVPNTGPFINYFWGIRNIRGGEDIRHGLVEFTPGAMGNLLRFVRQASADNIKGAAKPAAVVLERELVPYTYNKATQQMTWNEEGREKLRETMRRGLPVFDNFYGGSYGYIWNPKPQDRTHPDFTVEYLLDVKPMPPFIYFTGNDDFVLSDAEVDTLYQYIIRGGAIWGDCGFAGDRSKFDTAFRREMKRVVPDEDKPFRPLRKEGDLFISGPDAYFDAANDFKRLPYGMQYYDAPIEVIEVMPGIVSVVLTKNAYGNFLRFETAVVNNRFQVGGDIDRGAWATTMWRFREEFFRGLNNESIIDAYKLGTNILVYMLGRWPTVLNQPQNKAGVP